MSVNLFPLLSFHKNHLYVLHAQKKRSIDNMPIDQVRSELLKDSKGRELLQALGQFQRRIQRNNSPFNAGLMVMIKWKKESGQTLSDKENELIDYKDEMEKAIRKFFGDQYCFEALLHFQSVENQLAGNANTGGVSASFEEQFEPIADILRLALKFLDN